MLDQKDLQAIKEVMREELSKSENLILKEMGRVQDSFDKQIEQVSKNLEDLKQYYKVDKLENENTALLLQIVTELKKEVDALKDKIA